MTLRPPALAERLLQRALGDSDTARTILGDLTEDYASTVARRGVRRARLWYWRESTGLAASALFSRLLGRPITRDGSGKGTSMRDDASAVGFIEDARYAWRAIRRDPAFALFAMVVIGLGVGASTAVFSVMSPLMLRPLPFAEPERLVWIENDAGGGGLSAVTSRTSNLRDFRERARSFEGLAGYNAFFEQESFNLVGLGEPERLVGVGVTDDFLDVLGVRPRLGRDFTPEEGLWGGPAAIVLTHGFWVRRFGADPGVVGTAVTLNDQPHEIVGVLPPDFDFTSVFNPSVTADFLLPWAISEETDAWGNTTTIVGRLRPGVSAEAAQDELDAVVAALERADPERWGLGARVSGLQERMSRPFRTPMMLLAAAAGLVMLIVCVNLSNMLLARSPRRRREMAVRQTLGATRGRLVRQLLLESVTVSLGGAVLGAGFAVLATRFVTSSRAVEIPMLRAVEVDGGVLLFTIAVAVAAGLAVGIVPALQVAQGREAESLSGSSRGAAVGRGARRLREMLVVAEVATACVLLVFGGLVLRSFQRVTEVDLGFEPDDAVAWQISTARDFESVAAVDAYYDALVAEIEAVPGVESVGFVDALPLGRHRTWGTRIEGVTYEEDEYVGFFPHIVNPTYFEAMRIPLLEGRLLSEDDDSESAPVAVVNETAARTMFPDGRAIGSRFTMWVGEVEVVGVVGDVKHEALELASGSEFYFSTAQIWDYSTVDLVVRSPLAEDAVIGAVSAAIDAYDPTVPTDDVRALSAIVDRAISPRRFTLQLLGAFALCALLLAGLGIYGVLSYSVTERIPEIGIRMALGESAGEVRRTVVGRTLVLAVLGVVLGVGVSLLGTRMIDSLLFGVEPTDPVTFAGMVVVLLGVAALAGAVPAWRASRTDSATALRSAA